MTAYYNEFDPGAAAWLRELIRAGLIADGDVDERSILDVRPSELRHFTQCHFFAGIGGWSYALRIAGWDDDRPVWTGSPPCQPFSAAGAGLSQDDPRHLAPHFVRLVGACRPGVLFGEQVASAEVFGKAASGARKRVAEPPAWAWLDDLSDRLEAARYAVGASDFPSAGVGAPHIRQRTFFGAVSHEWLADAECRAAERHGQPLAAAPGGMQGAAREQRLRADAGHGIDFGGMADDASLRRFGRRADEAGAEPGSQQRSDGLRDAGRLVHGLGAGLEGYGGHGDGSREPGWLDQDATGSVAATGADGGMADDTRSGWREECQDDRGRAFGDCAEGFAAGSGASGSDLRSSPLHGFWADADWLLCRDGKWRPVEPGLKPLAHGVSGRVGLLRGYGNAINPHAAAQFIKAFRESVEMRNAA